MLCALALAGLLLALAARAQPLAPSAGNVWLGAFEDAAAGTEFRAVGMGALAYGITNVTFLGPSKNGTDIALFAGLACYTGGVLYDGSTQHRNGRGAHIRPAGGGLAVPRSL